MENYLESFEIYNSKTGFIKNVGSLPKLYLILMVSLFILIFFSVGSFLLKNNPEFLESIIDLKKSPETNDENKVKSTSEPLMETTKKSTPKTNKIETNTGHADYSTLKQDILKSDFIKELPKDGKILLSFYNFNKGYREWERSYIIEKNSVKQGEIKERDMKIFIHSKYVQEIKNKDICEVLRNAKLNGDLGVETDKSKTSLMWKYRSISKYRDCLGI